MIYPNKIANRLAAMRHNRPSVDSDATGTAVNFSCGCFIRFSLSIDTETRIVADAGFSSNGCGFMLVAGNVVAESIIKKELADLHGLTDGEMSENLRKMYGEFPAERRECADACGEALRAAFADFRTKRMEEFQGEKALICTCFGVLEETLENLISKNSLTTVDEVAAKCNAGSGCGSCRMLIQEMLERPGFQL